jgi:hypothetical protein
MPSQIQNRPFTVDERTEVQRWLDESPTDRRRLKEFLENSLVRWAVIMLGSVALVAALRWLSGRVGWQHREALLSLPLLGAIGLAAVAYAGRSSAVQLCLLSGGSCGAIEWQQLAERRLNAIRAAAIYR